MNKMIKEAVVTLAGTDPDLARELLASVNPEKYHIALMNFVREFRRAIKEEDINLSVSELRRAMGSLAKAAEQAGGENSERLAHAVSDSIRKHFLKMSKRQVNHNAIHEGVYKQILDGAFADAEKAYKAGRNGKHSESVRHLADMMDSIATALVAVNDHSSNRTALKLKKSLSNLANDLR